MGYDDRPRCPYDILKEAPALWLSSLFEVSGKTFLTSIENSIEKTKDFLPISCGSGENGRSKNRVV
jgi:hypothetical protein